MVGLPSMHSQHTQHLAKIAYDGAGVVVADYANEEPRINNVVCTDEMLWDVIVNI